MRDTTLRYRGPQSVPPWLRARAEHAPVRSPRPLWAALLAYTLLVGVDVSTTLAVFSQVAGRGEPLWRWEWNPLVAAVLRVGGTTGWLAAEALCIVVPWVVSLLTWRTQFDWSMADSPRAQVLIRRLVLVPLVGLCVWRAGAASFNLVPLVLAPLGGPGPSPVLTAASPTPEPTATATATTVPTPTSTPRPTPRLAISPTPPGPVTACQGKDATFTVTYVGNANPATITVTSTSTKGYAVSLDNKTFRTSVTGQIASGTTATVWVRALSSSASPRAINITVTGFSQQQMTANTTGCG